MNIQIPIEQAEDLLSHLKHLHTLHGECDGPQTCQAARAINTLELDIATAKRTANERTESTRRHAFLPLIRLCVACDRPLAPDCVPTVNRCIICPE
jgi:hypothetical protein